MSSTVHAVHRSDDHHFSKQPVAQVEVVAGLGVVGDAHSGATVKHRSRVAADPTQPNLRQIHLIHRELLQQVAGQGFTVAPGDLGENITTDGLDLLGLPVGSILAIGDRVLLALTGLRNPCGQIDSFQSGLLAAVRPRSETGSVQRLSGVMAVAVSGGIIAPGDRIEVALPPGPHRPLQPV